MSIFIPFIILSIWTYSLANFYKTNLTRAYLIVSILIIILSILFGKIGLLVFTIHSINFFSFFLLGYLLYSKKYSIYNFKKLVLFLIIYSVLVLISKDLFFYKYDEFSEYGITSKLIFTENAIPSNIDYVQKGSHHKLNLISYFHYFFLKNSTKIFQENIVYLSHSFFLIILISVILSFINEKPKKKIFIGVIFYFLIYILGPGLDRVYVDSILGLSFAIILLLYFNQNNKKSDQLLLFLLIFILPMIKPNGLLVVIGLISIFIFSFFLKRRSKNLVLVIAAFLLNFLFTEYYISDLRKYNILLSSSSESSQSSESSESSQIRKYEVHESSSFKINNYQFLKTELNNDKILNKETINDFIKKQFNELNNSGIYHSKTFLIINKILSKININFKFTQINLNIFFWILLLTIIAYVIYKKEEDINIGLTTLCFFGFTISYFVFLVFWAYKHNLIKEDLSLSVSWQRHLGTLILGYLIYLLVKFFKFFKSYLIIILFLMFAINTAPANSIRIFLPFKIIKNDEYWNDRYNQRLKIKKISKIIDDELGEYSDLFFLLNKDDPYLVEILKYELIKINTIIKSKYNFENFNFKKSNLNVISNEDYEIINLKKELNINKQEYKNLKINKKIDLNHNLYLYELTLNNTKKNI